MPWAICNNTGILSSARLRDLQQCCRALTTASDALSMHGTRWYCNVDWNTNCVSHWQYSSAAGCCWLAMTSYLLSRVPYPLSPTGFAPPSVANSACSSNGKRAISSLSSALTGCTSLGRDMYMCCRARTLSWHINAQQTLPPIMSHFAAYKLQQWRTWSELMAYLQHAFQCSTKHVFQPCIAVHAY